MGKQRGTREVANGRNRKANDGRKRSKPRPDLETSTSILRLKRAFLVGSSQNLPHGLGISRQLHTHERTGERSEEGEGAAPVTRTRLDFRGPFPFPDSIRSSCCPPPLLFSPSRILSQPFPAVGVAVACLLKPPDFWTKIRQVFCNELTVIGTVFVYRKGKPVFVRLLQMPNLGMTTCHVSTIFGTIL